MTALLGLEHGQQEDGVPAQHRGCLLMCFLALQNKNLQMTTASCNTSLPMPWPDSGLELCPQDSADYYFA